MQYHFIWVGETRESYLKTGEAQFFKRLQHYARYKLSVVKGEKVSKSISNSQVMEIEGTRIHQKVAPESHVVALDRTGKKMSSETLASTINQWQNRALREVAFIIGGPLGLDPAVLKLADNIWSLSDLTLTHEMARLILLEQVYRAHTILRGEKYHK